MMWLLLIAQIIALDVILSGDNALVIAGATNALPKQLRDIALIGGIGIAIIARVLLVGFVGLLMHVKIIGVVGGLLLFWVAYRMVKGQFVPNATPDKPASVKVAEIAAAIIAIVGADISMSLDNVVALAGLTKGHPFVMFLGLVLSMGILAFGAKLVASFIEKHTWLNYAGAALVAWVGITLIV